MAPGNPENSQEQNRRLAEQNQRLQRENKRLKEALRLEELPARVREVEEKNTQLTRVSLHPAQHASPASPRISCVLLRSSSLVSMHCPRNLSCCMHCFAFHASCCAPPQA